MHVCAAVMPQIGRSNRLTYDGDDVQHVEDENSASLRLQEEDAIFPIATASGGT